MARKKQPPEKIMALKDAHMTLYLEKTPRVCRCTLCCLEIVKQTNRVTMEYVPITPIKPSTQKGVIFKRRWFFHPDCLKGWTEPAGESRRYHSTIVCCDCGIPLTWIAGHVWAGKGGRMKYLCEQCIKTPRWRYCQFCQQYAHRYESSPLIIDGILQDKFACDRCQEESNALTVKAKKRLRRQG